jgi:hypothetical protein
MSILHGITNLFSPSRVEKEIDAELKSNVEMRTHFEDMPV